MTRLWPGSRLEKGMIQVQGECEGPPHVGWEHAGYLLQKITITGDDTLLFICSEDSNIQESLLKTLNVVVCLFNEYDAIRMFFTRM